MRKLLLLSILSLTLAASPAWAKTVYCTNCSNRFTQAMERVTNVEQLKTILKQYTEMVEQTRQQIALVQNNIQQYQNMVQNTLALPESILNSAKSDFAQLAELTSSLKTNRGDISALTQIFDQLYPSLDLMGGIVNDANKNYDDVLGGWAKAADDAAEAVFQLTGYQLDDMVKNSAQLDQHIDKLLSTPEGQMQAIQAGNNLASLQLQESQQLRELLAASIQAGVQAQMKGAKKEQYLNEVMKEISRTNKLKEQYKGYE